MNSNIPLGFNLPSLAALDAQLYISQFNFVMPSPRKYHHYPVSCAYNPVGYLPFGFPSESQIGACGNAEACISVWLQQNLEWTCLYPYSRLILQNTFVNNMYVWKQKCFSRKILWVCFFFFSLFFWYTHCTAQWRSMALSTLGTQEAQVGGRTSSARL